MWLAKMTMGIATIDEANTTQAIVCTIRICHSTRRARVSSSTMGHYLARTRLRGAVCRGRSSSTGPRERAAECAVPWTPCFTWMIIRAGLSSGTIMDLGGWLRHLGLEQYEAIFRDNAINEKVLPRLTAEDLKDLGVVIVGHRRTLLDAIAVLRADADAKAAPADAVPVIDTSPKDAAERRQVTVMFSDLVGSTALSARMDPEDLREVISAYQKCVAETVGRFGGFVAKYMGDGVLVYFGYPQAHEDDAERAVRAGLELIAAVAGLKTRASLQTRVGIATGLVVVGDLIGAGAAQEQAVVGETPNLAARLQGIAEPNMVVIAEDTRRLLGNLFELGDLGAKNLKGIAGPLHAWAALRASCGKPLRGAAHDRPHRVGRAGRRTRIAAAALVQGKDR